MKPMAWLLSHLLFGCLSALAQTQPESPPSAVIGLRLHRGFIIPHSDSIADISFSKPYRLELDASLHLTKQSVWQYCNCFPRVGLSFFYTNFDNRIILGDAFSVMPYIEPHFRADKKLNFSFRFGLGASYLSNVYDAATNPRNLFYSSPVSFLLMANLSVNYRITPQIWARLAGNYNHISNGGLQNPNKGINFPTVSWGIDYVWPAHSFQPYHKVSNWRQLHPQRRSWQIAGFGVAKKAFREESQRFAVVGVAISVSQVVGKLHALTLGAEYIADFAQKATIRRLGKVGDFQDVGIFVGHEFLIGKFSLSQALGVYLVSHSNNLDPVYQRYGLTYQWTERIAVGINMKVHRNVADFLDLRMIYSVRKK